MLRALAGAHHDGHGGGEAQRAGAGDDQHRHAGGEGHLYRVGSDEPHHGGDEGDAHDHGDEHTGHPVGQLGDGGLGGGGLVHQTDHLGKGGVLTHPGGPDGEGAGFVDGGGDDGVPRLLVHGDGLAGEGGFVHGGCALGDHAVHGDGAAGADQQHVTQLDLLHRHFDLFAIPEDGGRFGGEVDEPGNGLSGLALGAGLQIFAQGDEGENHAGRLKIEVHGILFHHGHIHVAQSPADAVQGGDTVDHGGGGAYGNEGVHVGGEVEQRLKAHPVVFLVDDHDGHGEQEQGEGVGHGIFHAMEEVRDGPAHHVAHGQVEQGNEEDEGGDEPGLHALQLILHGVGSGDGGGVLPRRGGQGCAVACLLHRGDDGLRRDGIVAVHCHGAAQQVHVHVLHSRQLPHGLVHMSGARRAGHTGNGKFLFHDKTTRLSINGAPLMCAAGAA